MTNWRSAYHVILACSGRKMKLKFFFSFVSIGISDTKNSIQFFLCLFWLLIYLGTRTSGWGTVAPVMGTPAIGRKNHNWLTDSQVVSYFDFEYWQYLWSLRISFRLFVFPFFLFFKKTFLELLAMEEHDAYL